MNYGRKATSTLSKRIVRFRPRDLSPDRDENTPPTLSGRSVRSMATAQKEREQHATKRRKVLAGAHYNAIALHT